MAVTMETLLNSRNSTTITLLHRWISWTHDCDSIGYCGCYHCCGCGIILHPLVISGESPANWTFDLILCQFLCIFLFAYNLILYAYIIDIYHIFQLLRNFFYMPAMLSPIWYRGLLAFHHFPLSALDNTASHKHKSLCSCSLTKIIFHFVWSLVLHAIVNLCFSWQIAKLCAFDYIKIGIILNQKFKKKIMQSKVCRGFVEDMAA